jgi:hypothetical protein
MNGYDREYAQQNIEEWTGCIASGCVVIITLSFLALFGFIILNIFCK